MATNGPQTHTPNASVSGVNAPAPPLQPSGAQSVDRIGNNASATTTSSDSGGTFTFRLSSSVPIFNDKEYGKGYSFRSHALVQTYLKVFAKVELVRVRAFVYQASVQAADPKNAVESRLVRFGLGPRSLTTHSTSGTGNNAVVNGHVDVIPSLREMLITTMIANSAEYVWGEGGEPFPPGMLTDLRDGEKRFNYVCFYLAQTAIGTTDAKIAGAQLDFTIRCSEPGYQHPDQVII